MPNFDGTGPLGQGAKTGKMLGPCNNIYKENIVDYKIGFGRRNRGYGYKQRNGFNNMHNPGAIQQQLTNLEYQIKEIKQYLKNNNTKD